MAERGQNRMLVTCLVVICGVSCVVGPAVALAAGVFFFSFSADPGPIARPIIRLGGERRTAVVIAIDDLRNDHLAAYGYGRDPAPTLTALAERGDTIRGYLPATVATSPALATLLTGMPPWEHGLASARELGAHRLPRAVETLPEALRDAGWRTFGAVSRPHLSGRLSGLGQGFEEWRETYAPASEVLASLDPDLAAELSGDADVFLFLHFGDLTKEGLRTDLLEEYLEPFRVEDPDVDAALRASDVLAELEQAVGRQRGSPAWLAFRSALYDAELAEVDAAVGEVLDLLEGAEREDAIVAVVGTRGKYFDEYRPPEGAPEEFSRTLLETPAITANLLLADGIGTADLSRDLHRTLLQSAERGEPGSLVAGPSLREVASVTSSATIVVTPGDRNRQFFSTDDGVELEVTGDFPLNLPAALAQGFGWWLDFQGPDPTVIRLRSKDGQLFLPEEYGQDLRVSPAGTSLEGNLVKGTEFFAATATRTAVLALDVEVDGEEGEWATTLPVFPPKRDGSIEAKLRVTRDGPWALITCDAGPGEEVRVVARGYPLEPFDPALEIEAANGSVLSLPGLDTVVATSTGPQEFRVRLRARQTLALEATVGGRGSPLVGHEFRTWRCAGQAHGVFVVDRRRWRDRPRTHWNDVQSASRVSGVPLGRAIRAHE